MCSGIRTRGSNEESSEEGMHYRQPHHHNNRGIPKNNSDNPAFRVLWKWVLLETAELENGGLEKDALGKGCFGKKERKK